MEIVWSKKAQLSLEVIHQFYIRLYGKKKAREIKNDILDTPDILEFYPFSGKTEERFSEEGNNKIVRALIQQHCKILYEVIENQDVILILVVFDTRQDPNKMSI